MLKKYLVSFIICISALQVAAQVTVQFIPEVYGRNVNGLFNAKIISVSQRFSANLTITVSERKGGTVCIIKTPDFLIAPGSNNIPVTAARSASIQFAANRLGQLTGQSRNFPEGEYDYCYSLTIRNSDLMPQEQCFSYELAPFAELSLVDPYNRDTICNKRPVFSWQPLIPSVSGSYYQLVLTEVKSGQNATEALNYNLPIINQHSIMVPVLPYPAIANQLEQGKKYAWQVTAYKDQTILNRSEVWEFFVNCPDSVKKVTSRDDGYRDIADLLRGNYYIAYNEVKFALINPYQKATLDYDITPLGSNSKKVKHLPKITLQNGSNKIEIDLKSTGDMVDGRSYLLHVRLADGSVKILRFLYKEVP